MIIPQKPHLSLIEVLQNFEPPGFKWFGSSKFRLDYDSEIGWMIRKIGVFERIGEWWCRLIGKEGHTAQTKWSRVVTKLQEYREKDAAKLARYRTTIHKTEKIANAWRAVGGNEIENVFKFPAPPQNMAPKSLAQPAAQTEISKTTADSATYVASKPCSKKRKKREEVFDLGAFERLALHSQPPISAEPPPLSMESTPTKNPSIPKDSENVHLNHNISSSHQRIREASPPSYPLALQNNRFNCSRCYIDATLEMLLSQIEIRDLVRKCAQDKELLPAKRRVFEAIVALMDKKEVERKNSDRSLAEDCRRAMMACDEGDFKQRNLRAQLDAASVIDLLFETVKEMSINIANIDTWEEMSQPLVRYDRPETKLTLPLRQANSIEEALKSCFEVREIEGRDVSLNEQKRDLRTVQTKPVVVKAPDFLCLHLKRFAKGNRELIKLNHSMALPHNGVVDLTPYMSTESSNQFEVVGVVIHSGGLQGGHYTANVKIGDRYFHCDDMETDAAEISREAFLACQDSYLILLKRIKV